MTRDDEAEYVNAQELQAARERNARIAAAYEAAVLAGERCEYAGCLGPADGSECRHPRPEDDGPM
jgi:hypothetical protein